MQNYCLDVIENLLLANMLTLADQKRLEHQREAGRLRSPNYNNSNNARNVNNDGNSNNNNGENGKIVQKIKAASRKRIFSKVKSKKNESFCNDTEEIQHTLASYKGHLLRGNSWRVYEKIVKIMTKKKEKW